MKKPLVGSQGACTRSSFRFGLVFPTLGVILALLSACDVVPTPDRRGRPTATPLSRVIHNEDPGTPGSGPTRTRIPTVTPALTLTPEPSPTETPGTPLPTLTPTKTLTPF